MTTATGRRHVGGSLALLRRLSAQSLDYVGRRIAAVWDERWDPAATDMERVYYHPDPEALRDLSPAEQVAAYFALSDHEVGGHLRFTDRQAWDAFVRRQESWLRGLAHALLNILEDARIERAHIERWLATRARLAWLNERYYQVSPPIRPDMQPAEALLMALNQAKFAWYYGHQPGYKGQLPADVEAYWPEAAALLDAARRGSTTADAVHAAEAILETMRQQGWLTIPPDLPQRVGLSPHLDSSGSPRAPGTNKPQPAPPQPQPAPADRSRKPRGRQKPPGQADDADEAEDASNAEPPEDSAPSDRAPEADEAKEARDGRDQVPAEDEADAPEGAGDEAGTTVEEAGDSGADHRGTAGAADGDDEEPESEPDEADDLDLDDDQDFEDPGDDGDDPAAGDAEADAERVLDEASAVLAALEREDRDCAQAAAATLQELSEMRDDLGSITAEGLPPDLHAGIEAGVEVVPPRPVELEPLYRAMRPEGLRLAQALERLLQRQRSIRRGLRRGKPDPVRIRLEELTDRVYLQRPRRASHFDVAVLVMCDESGSMTGTRCTRAREALMMFHIALHRLGIRHAAAGFSAGGAQVLHRVYFGFGQSLHPSAWWHLVNGPDAALGAYALANARDGYSLRWGARWLACQPELRKILIFLSDGEVNHDWAPPGVADPYAYHYGLANPRRVGPRDTRAAVREAERLGVTVIGVSIGDSWGYMAELYPRRVCCRDVAELPDALCRILLGQVAG